MRRKLIERGVLRLRPGRDQQGSPRHQGASE
jgi:hypothetical protein